MSTDRLYPQTEGVFIPGSRGRIFSTIYLPAGGPAPVVIVCHGLPGIEKMIDYAHALREEGFSVVTFYYSGSWGSDGTFSLANCIEDTNSVVDFILADDAGWFDKEKIYIMGHSLGGLVTSSILANRPEVKAGAVIMPANIGLHYRSTLNDPKAEADQQYLHSVEFGEWLNGYSWEVLKEEAAEDSDRFELSTFGKGMSEKDVLLIAGDRDFLLPVDENVGLLRDAIEKAGGKKPGYAAFDTDHGMNTCRAEIKRTLIEFFKSV